MINVPLFSKTRILQKGASKPLWIPEKMLGVALRRTLSHPGGGGGEAEVGNAPRGSVMATG